MPGQSVISLLGKAVAAARLGIGESLRLLRNPEELKTRSRALQESTKTYLALKLEAPPPPEEESSIRPDESPVKYARVGWIIVAVFFGVFGIWSMIAPLNGAVLAQAVVKVEGNRKSLEHLDGGIVQELYVKEGDHVKAGTVLITLDDAQARSDYEVLTEQRIVLRATEARLLAELKHASELIPPDLIAARLNEPSVADVWNAQVQQFESRNAVIGGQGNVLKEKINQLEAQIAGDRQQMAALQKQIDSVRQELKNIEPLVEKGLVAQPRRLTLERNAYALEGQIAGVRADIARANQAIAEQTQLIAQTDNDRMQDVSKDLRDTQALLLEVGPKLANATAQLARTDIRAPYTGTVVGLSVFGIGSVIQRGEKILDIVPDDDELSIEAHIAVDDISDVHPGALAQVHFTAYKQRITPVARGEVLQISADRLTDERTGTAYYVAIIQIDKNDMAEMPDIHLYPGMPASVSIPTVQRTAFDYLVGPLASAFDSAFRQK